MKIKQISIFLENTAGRIADVTKALKEAGVNLRALMIADTADFGILRIIADDSEHALEVLKKAKFTTRTTDVLAVSVKDSVGSLHEVMQLFQSHGINIEYLYASMEKTGNTAVIIFKVEDADKGLAVIKNAGLSGSHSL
ncbi:ACT domain-containing protein [Treponema brennaborense]|uniref:Amino acid-binding ACT domain protein n=1 Tax=Treponema brennaborense (strain DSM 12168 / CIP 105900 / DD5/3) TaxID=906968 RepID=F4LQ92_TREBD|nr:ACT domain-containing protein [Treponema brennaborense]AEE16113.1 amino acid-binding ACT domain protein [Treponema brennaborense DSM 12168]